MNFHSRAAIALAASIAFPVVALADTQVLGNGIAADCSQRAIAGKSDRVTLDLCTMALETEQLTRADSAKTYVNRGVVNLRRGAYISAERDFNAAERRKSSLPEIFINRGALLIYQKQYEAAVREIEKGMALNPDEPEKGYFNRALAREAMMDVKGAYLDYLKASQLDPQWEQPRKELERFSVAQGGPR